MRHSLHVAALVLTGLAPAGSLSADSGEVLATTATPVPAETLAATPEDPFAGTLLGDAGGLRQRWADRGFTAEFTYIGEVLGNLDGGRRRGVTYEGLARLTLDLDLARSIGWEGARFHAIGLYPHGKGLSEQYVGDLLALSNIDGWDSPMVFEAWLEQSFWDQRLALRAGWMAADEEFAYVDTGLIFVHSNFGWPAIIAYNAPTPAFPRGVLGTFASYSANDRLRFQCGIYDGDPSGFDRHGQPRDDHGVHWTFDEGALVMAETDLHWGDGEGASGRPGRLRLGGWYHTGEFPDQRVGDDGRSLADPAGTGQPRLHRGNGGFYLAAEQRVLALTPHPQPEGPGVGVFLRLGWSPPDRSLLEYYANGGVVWQGPIPGRPTDRLGVGLVHANLSRDVRGLARDEQRFQGSTEPLPDYETALECTYEAEVLPGWSVQPWVQYIVHPGGSAALPNATVVGLRTTMTF